MGKLAALTGPKMRRKEEIGETKIFQKEEF
jgi:hypothetical protein